MNPSYAKRESSCGKQRARDSRLFHTSHVCAVLPLTTRGSLVKSQSIRAEALLAADNDLFKAAAVLFIRGSHRMVAYQWSDNRMVCSSYNALVLRLATAAVDAKMASNFMKLYDRSTSRIVLSNAYNWLR